MIACCTEGLSQLLQQSPPYSDKRNFAVPLHLLDQSLLIGNACLSFPDVPLRHFQWGLSSFQLGHRPPAAICD